MRILPLLLLACTLTQADTLALKNGRFVDGVTIEKTELGYRLKYKNGDILVPYVLVSDYFREDGNGTWIPTTSEEKAQAEKGKAPWKGRWITAAYREKLRLKAVEDQRKRIEQQKQRRLWRNRATIKTRRFIYNHTLPDEVFNRLQDLFEAYYTFFTKYWRIRPSSKYGKATVNIYHSREYFEQVSGAPDGVVGWYHPLTKELHFYYDRQRHRFTLDVMFHEGNHMLTHMINERVLYPWWVGEGMAEYFGASLWDPKTKTMSVGHLQSARLAVLKYEIDGERWLKLDTMLRADRMGAVEYSWAWSFCHFLLSSERYKKGFRKFFLSLGKSSSVKKHAIGLGFKRIKADEAIAALKRYLRIKDIEKLEQEWYDYIGAGLSRRKDVDYAAAGWIMKLYGQPKKARLLLKKAIANGSKEAHVYYDYAELRFSTKPKVALKYARLATERDPLHARAWGLIGRCVADEDYDEAMRLLKLAMEIDPDDNLLWVWAEMVIQEEKDK